MIKNMEYTEYIIDKAKETMTNLGIAKANQTIEAVCIFAKAEQLSESKRIREEVTIGVMDYDF